MDLNQLLFRQQVSLMRADAAACVEARQSHRGLASAYTQRIAQLQQELGTLEATA